MIDLQRHTVLATIKVGRAPDGVAVDPAGKLVYVTNSQDDTISVIDAATHGVVATIKE
ncbi:MAG TPA: hypothetical protein VHR45_13890 [Thermoanaerobaculia bacterium]|nr:hypothetical protein [Thermoanaerobaculia bacterium]